MAAAMCVLVWLFPDDGVPAALRVLEVAAEDVGEDGVGRRCGVGPADL